jgi:Mn-dependent DtxR family transcriptional regulator
MSIDIMILRAMLRLARRRKAADEGEVAVRVGGAPGSVRAALRRLDARGLVERRPGEPPRLTMAGFAVAVALLPEQPVQAIKLRSVRTSRAA